MIGDNLIIKPEQFFEYYSTSNLIRTKQVDIFLDVFNSKPDGRYIIYGAPGMGKTTFLYMVTNELLKQGKRVVHIDGWRHRKGFDLQYNALIDNTIFLIDGLDEMYTQQWIKEIRYRKLKCICTARRRIYELDFDFELNLHMLTQEEMFQLISKRFGEYQLDENIFKKTLSMAKDVNLSPHHVLTMLYKYIADGDSLEPFLRNIPEEMYQAYIYGKGLDIACPKILLPENNRIVVPEEVKNDIKVLNKSLLDEVAQNSDILYLMKPREFEEMVCELFERKGYKVKLTKQTHDGGKDIIILNDSMLGDLVFYVECKQFSKSIPVKVSLVRELYGVVEADRATAGIMITTSYYSEDAKKFRDQIKTRMQLIDYVELIREIQMETNKRI